MSLRIANSSASWDARLPYAVASNLKVSLLQSFADWPMWQYILAFTLALVVYDQGLTSILHLRSFSHLFLPILIVMYIKRKGSIAGPALKMPLMGPFLQALEPKFENYLAQWASGPLSCVSVFHKYRKLPSY